MSKTPTVGFVSLGCPKATVDSERILTQLRMEGMMQKLQVWLQPSEIFR